MVETGAEFGPLATTDWLGRHLNDANVKVIDGSWRMPGEPPAYDDYCKRHIAGAAFFDIDAVADQASPLPHMLPPPAQFADAVGGLGISNDDIVIVYDDHGLFSAARVWWTFRVMGHANVAVLDGGLPKWLSEDRPVSAEEPSPTRCDYRARLQDAQVCSADELRALLTDPSAAIADARPAARFCGEAPEPRPGLRAGHMPDAGNLPFDALLRDDGTMRAPEEIRSAFAAAGIDLEKRIVTTCGSGVTAAVLSLALARIGHRRCALYDGSWAEWGDARHADEEFPVIAES